MNKYQKVIAQMVKDDKAKETHQESFRTLRNAYRLSWKNNSFADLVSFKNWNKKLSI